MVIADAINIHIIDIRQYKGRIDKSIHLSDINNHDNELKLDVNC